MSAWFAQVSGIFIVDGVFHGQYQQWQIVIVVGDVYEHVIYKFFRSSAFKCFDISFSKTKNQSQKVNGIVSSDMKAHLNHQAVKLSKYQKSSRWTKFSTMALLLIDLRNEIC